MKVLQLVLLAGCTVALFVSAAMGEAAFAVLNGVSVLMLWISLKTEK